MTLGRILMADLQATRGLLEPRLPPDFQATSRRLPGDSKVILATSPVAGDFQATRGRLAGNSQKNLSKSAGSKAFWSKQTETKSIFFDMHHSFTGVVEVTLK